MDIEMAASLAPDTSWRPLLTSEPERRYAQRGDISFAVGPDQHLTCWDFEWSRRLAKNVYATHRGRAPCRAAAEIMALSYQPKLMVSEYDGRRIEWVGVAPSATSGRLIWIAAIDGDHAEVFGAANTIDGAAPWRWRREYSLGAQVLTLTGGDMSGGADCQLSAMIAAIDAPRRLRLACATLIADLRQVHP
jgi:hypothetical protein